MLACHSYNYQPNSEWKLMGIFFSPSSQSIRKMIWDLASSYLGRLSPQSMVLVCERFLQNLPYLLVGICDDCTDCPLQFERGVQRNRIQRCPFLFALMQSPYRFWMCKILCCSGNQCLWFFLDSMEITNYQFILFRGHWIKNQGRENWENCWHYCCCRCSSIGTNRIHFMEEEEKAKGTERTDRT